jgi:hypothetical protein
MTFGRIIFGDNQFLGVNHASPTKAMAMQDRFANPDAIIEVLGWAYDAGIRHFMFTTHDRLAPVFDEIVNSRLFPDMAYIPSLPYAHKYADAMTDGGPVAVIKKHLSGCPKRRLIGSASRVVTGDFSASMEMLIEIELLMTKGLNVQGVFLLNIIFDLIIGMRSYGMLERFYRYVSDRFGVMPGFITMNHPLAQTVLCDELGIKSPWICSNFNSAGFRMNPSQPEVVSSYSNGLSKNIAMSVFASGALAADESIAYIHKFSGVDSVLFGSSSKKNIEATVALINC